MSRRLLVVDNYDSFTYNLVQYLGELGEAPEVVRNDALTVAEVVARAPLGVVISPGPCTPMEAGISTDLVRELGPTIPILGVCLGHQCIGEAYGGVIVRAPQVMHGKLSLIHHDGEGVFAGIANPFTATRYHSLVIDPQTVPAALVVTARTEDGVIMGVRHREHPVEGVQFHPESILTEGGHRLLDNFLDRCRARATVTA
ncbi:MAG: aminodeoxychorismate/anthranilate synthase component II [Candidatus Dormibacteraeota bacterium]|nr:aminodeoxychorismate/anthranilate synthase component II [Candidatus Dormibacteraeota bacterium]